MAASPKVQVLVRLPVDLHDKLEDYMLIAKVNKTQVIISALEEFLQKKEENSR